jgi:hypothetical protein
VAAVSVDSYDYERADGSYLFTVVVERSNGEKRVRQGVRQRDGSYTWNLNGVEPVLYRLPELFWHVAAGKPDPIYIPEGEQDVEALRKLGLTATCNPMGAGKWREWFTDDLAGARHVRVVADADEPGRAHAAAVYASLEPVCDTVELLEPPADLGEHADVSDLLDAGRSLDELVPLDPSKSVRSSKGMDLWTERGALPIDTLAAKLENVPDEPEWTWDSYLAPCSVTLLAGRPKVGKSTLVFGLMTALEHGAELLDRPTRAAGVLLLSEEREGTLAEKRQRFNLDGEIHLLMRHEVNGRPWPEVVAEAVAYCQEHGLGVLVVDTFDKWTGLKGDAENNAGSVIEALEPLLAAAGAGLAVLIVAHQRKSFGDFGEAVRGSNALTGGVDVVLELERPRSDALAGDGVRQLKAVSRYASTPEELVVALTDSGYEARGDTLEAKADAERAQVLETIETLGAATYNQLREDTGLPKSNVLRHVQRLLADGEIQRDGEGGKKDPYRFRSKGPTLTGPNQTEELFS